jgi:hypothetical protein
MSGRFQEQKGWVPSNILDGFQVHQYILAIYNNYSSFAVAARGFAAVLTKVGWLSRGQNSYDSVWGLSTPVFQGMDGEQELHQIDVFCGRFVWVCLKKGHLFW